MKTITDILEICNLETLTEADLTGIDLNKSNLSHVYLKNINFRNTTLSYSKLNWSHLSDCDFKGANLSHIKVRKTKLYKVNFSEANLSYADLEKINFTWGGIDLTKTDLSYANLKEAQFTIMNGTNLSHACLQNSDLRRTLENVNLSNADLSGACLYGSKLVNCNLENAIITPETRFNGAIFKNTILFGKVIDKHENEPLLREIAKIVLPSPDKLSDYEQSNYYSNRKDYSLLGWAITLAPNGKALTTEMGYTNAALSLLGGKAFELSHDEDGCSSERRKNILKYLAQFL